MRKSPANEQRSKVKPAGRTVTDAEVLTQEHDTLLLRLHAALPQVCEFLFGLSTEQLKDLEQQRHEEAIQLLTDYASRARALLAPGFTYKPADTFFPHDGPSAPGAETLELAAKVQETAQRALVAVSAPDLYESTRVTVRETVMQAELTKSTEKANTWPIQHKVELLGHVDLQVEFTPPATVRVVLKTGDPASEASSFWNSYFQTEEYTLHSLRAAQEHLSAGYSREEQAPNRALFTVRTGEWTVGEVLQEMRNLRRSDQGEHARVVLVVPDLSDGVLRLINEQGFLRWTAEPWRRCTQVTPRAGKNRRRIGGGRAAALRERIHAQLREKRGRAPEQGTEGLNPSRR